MLLSRTQRRNPSQNTGDAPVQETDPAIGLYGVPGWLMRREAQLLYDCALEAPVPRVLELGTFCGRSACVLATALRRRDGTLLCCDRFPEERQYETQTVNTLEETWKNLERYGLADTVVTLTGDYADTLAALRGTFGMVYVDGGHQRENTDRCIAYAMRSILPGGWLVFHDYRNAKYPDVQQCVDRAEQQYGLTESVQCGSIKAFRVQGNPDDKGKLLR